MPGPRRVIEASPAEPVRIVHSVDTAVDEATGALDYHYNLLDYVFAHPAGEVRARTYTDEIDKVAIYLPQGVGFADDGVKAVVAYLQIRFTEITHLTPEGYAPIPEAQK